MKIFLGDLQNSYYRYLRNTVPIGVGYVRAYLDKIFGKEIEIHLFRKFEEMHEATKSHRPDVLALGSYSWNTSITLKAAKYMRDRFPDLLTVVGGPDVSQFVARTGTDLKSHRFIDFRLPNEGETPMRNLVEACLGAGHPSRIRGLGIEGCLTLDPDTDEAVGNPIGRFNGDINGIPSPYLGGHLDRFLADQDYLPIVQTVRGCPYRCSFCVSGKDSWNKVRPFDVERVKEEFEYVQKRAANRYLRLADENFGIMPRDVEIADYIMKRRKETGFPSAVSIYTHKHPTERVKYISRIMKDCLPFNLSFQTIDPSVLKNIKRFNLKEEEVQGAIAFTRENNLTLVTELIFPLPGETLKTLLKGIDYLLERRFESISIGQLTLLKGSVMDLPEYREKHGYVTKFHVSDNGYTLHPDLENVEIDEFVVATHTMSKSDCYLVNKLLFLIDFGHFRSLLKELIFLAECHGIRTSKLLLSCIERPDVCPTLSEFANRCSDEIRDSFFDTPEEVVEAVRKVMEDDPSSLRSFYQIRDNLTIELLIDGRLADAVDEMARMIEILFIENHGASSDAFSEELEAVKRLTRESFIPVDRPVPEDTAIVTPFDLLAWRQDNYGAPLTEYRRETEHRVTLRVPNMPLYLGIWKNENETPTDKYRKNFLSINSANRRRVVVHSEPAR